MTSTSGLDRLSLTSPAALVAAIPYLLGFHPASSVVIVWLEARHLLLTQRVDLPPADRRAGEAWFRAVWGHAAAVRADELVVVAYGRALRPEIVTALVDSAEAAGISVRDLLVVCDGRWRSQLCTDERCCPEAGRAIPEGVQDTIRAEFALLGCAPLASRDEVVRGLAAEPENPDVVAAVDAGAHVCAESLEAWRDRSIADILSLLAAPTVASPAAPTMATVIIGLGDIRVRDTVLWEAARWSTEQLHTAVAVLQPVVRAAPVGWVAPVATCCAAMAWLAGDGARALTALERSTDDDADYSLARLLMASVTSGLPPAAWREAMASLSREQCRHGT